MRICYICGEEIKGRWRFHVEKYHPKFIRCFEWWFEGDPRIVVELLDKDDSYTVKGLTFGDAPFDEVVTDKWKKARGEVRKSLLLDRLEPFPKWSTISSEFLPVDYFGNYAEALVAIREMAPKDIPFDLCARFMCEQCGAYGRKRHCPPYIKPVEYYKVWVKRWEKCYILVFQSEGHIGWPKQPNGVGNRWGRSLAGVDAGLSVWCYRLLTEITKKLHKEENRALVAPPGPCKLCRREGCQLPPGGCRHPMPIGPTMEGMGIDVIQLAYGLGIPIQQPVFDFITKIGAIFVGRRE